MNLRPDYGTSGPSSHMSSETDYEDSHLQSREPSPSFRPRSLSITPSIDEKEDREGGWRREEEAYHALIADGGCPSHPVAFGYDVIDNPAKYKQYEGILGFWHSGGSGRYQEFSYQLITWRDFRMYQEKIRRFYNPRNRFQEYKNTVRGSQGLLGCEWNLSVLEDQHQQSRLEDWNEFRAFYCRRLEAFRKKIQPAERELFHYQKKFEDAEARLTDTITDPEVLHCRFDEIMDSEEKLAEAKSRVASAQQALQAAQRDKSDTLQIGMVQHELCSAKDNLNQVFGSEEMRRLRDGLELQGAQEVMVRAQAELSGAERDVRRWEVFLNWIDEQFLSIATECGHPTSDNPRQTNGFTRRRPGFRPLQEKSAKCKSVLTPSASFKISKASKRKPDHRTRQAIHTQVLPQATPQQYSVERPVAFRRSKRLQQSNDHRTEQVLKMSALHSVHFARVTKAQATSHTTKPGIGRGIAGCSVSRRSPRTKRSATSGKKFLRRSQRLAQKT